MLGKFTKLGTVLDMFAHGEIYCDGQWFTLDVGSGTC